MAKALKKITLFIILFSIFLVAGQYIGGLYLLHEFGQPLTDVKLLTQYEYVSFYGLDSSSVIKKELTISLFISLLMPAAVLIVFIAAVIPDSKVKKLHGAARFSNMSEIKEKGLLYAGKAETPKGKKFPPVLLGQYKGKYIADYSQLYTSVAAAPGAGKGVGFVIPNLLQYPHSCVVLDPKQENWEITAGYREQVLEQECFLFAPDADSDTGYKSHCWNPLDYVSDDEYHRLSSIKSITEILIPAPSGENQSFYLGAQNLVNGLILYLVESQDNEITMTNVLGLLQHEKGLEQWIVSAMESAKSSISQDCKNLLLTYANNANARGRDSIKNIALSSLSVFNTKTVAMATRKSDFRFEDLRKRKISIYVGITPPGLKTYRRLLNLFFSQCIVVNTKVLPERAPEDDPMPYQCLMLIDEFPALGKVDIIRESSGYTRGYNMRYALIYQNKSQLESKDLYEKEGAAALLKTMHNQVILKTDSNEDANEYSERMGNTTLKEITKSRSRGSQSSTTIGTNYHKRPLLLPQEIKSMPDKDALLFVDGLYPIYAEKIYWYKDKTFKQRGNMPVPTVPSLI